MTVDTSAIVAILSDEAERDQLENIIATENCAMSSVSYLEASIVLLRRRGEASFGALDAFIEGAGIVLEPFTAAQARQARNAHLRFGKGRHPAALNFGDCATYALAVERDDAVLFVGDDFKQTDIESAFELPTSPSR